MIIRDLKRGRYRKYAKATIDKAIEDMNEGKSGVKVAHDLGVPTPNVYYWFSQARKKANESANCVSPTTSPEESKLSHIHQDTSVESSAQREAHSQESEV